MNSASPGGRPDVDPARRLDHIVVVMFENRSFDNLLGRLYDPTEPVQVDGVLGKDLSNPIPPEVSRSSEGATVRLRVPTNFDTPDPDPGEEYPHVNTQLYGTVRPVGNAGLRGPDMVEPFNAPPEPRPIPSMAGFVRDYVNAYRVETGRVPSFGKFAQIMSSYTRDQLPVLTTLARSFACFDRWFCEVPSETYPNRSFFHAASSSGLVINGPRFVLENTAETIFNRMEQARPKVRWRVYFDPAQVVSATGLIHAPRLFEYFGTHFLPLASFFEDVRNGTLPDYAFIEPCMIPPHSDMHPPGAARVRRFLPFLPRPDAIRRGEVLLARIYDAVRGSTNVEGSNYLNTLLLVTFDEHGGTYDHVPPPAAVPPDPGSPAGQMGFKFDLSGVRIPTIAVSAWVDPMTVVHEEFRSTSVIRTLRSRWPQLGGPLTRRDASAADIAPVLSRPTPRLRETWPTVRAGATSVWARRLGWLDPGLPPLGRHLLASAAALEQSKTGKTLKIDVTKVGRRAAMRHLRGFSAARFAAAADAA